MKDTVLITGANGHLAKIVSQHLAKDYNLRYLTTQKISNTRKSYFHWDIEKEYIDPRAIKNCKHIIHLAGYPILRRWTSKNQKIMYDSRIKSTNLLLESCKLMKVRPKTFICASAIGIYDQSAKTNIDENSLKGNSWLAKMACDWEIAANQFKELGSRIVQMRISLIFSEEAGFLKYNLLSMKYGVGLIIGDRKRKVNWMHVEDISRFIKEAILNNCYNGPYNLASEGNISQENLIKLIRNNLFSYSIIIRIPMSVISFILGQRSQIIDTDIELETSKLKETGFKCKFNTLKKITDTIKLNQ